MDSYTCNCHQHSLLHQKLIFIQELHTKIYQFDHYSCETFVVTNIFSIILTIHFCLFLVRTSVVTITIVCPDHYISHTYQGIRYKLADALIKSILTQSITSPNSHTLTQYNLTTEYLGSE